MKYFRLISLLFLVFSFFSIPGETTVKRVYAAGLEAYSGGFFTIQKPSGWAIQTAGQCSTFAFLIRDTGNPLRQMFHFGEVGPVYLDPRQKHIDMQYMRMGGYPVNWIEMPVVKPLTPDNFLAQFHLIARTHIAQVFMPACPTLDRLQIISSTPQPSPITGATTALVRALFLKNGNVGEGLFSITVAPLQPVTGNPGGGIGYGFLVTGICAPKKEFKKWQQTLAQSIASYTLSRDYVNQCLQQQAAAYQGILRAGKTLRETSDMIMRGWENRNKTYDILAEKRSDVILGKERLYNPDTNEVYEFENGFYDRYDTRRNQYEMNNLKLLRGNQYDLWTTPTLDGPRHLR